MASRSASVAAAIEAYVTKLMETNAASRALWTEMRELYPSAGPLEATITRLGAWEVGSSPWTEHGTSNMAERMRMAAEEPTAQVRLDALRARARRLASGFCCLFVHVHYPRPPPLPPMCFARSWRPLQRASAR